MTNKELAIKLRNGLFAERDTLDEAWNYVELIAHGSNNPAAVYTAVQVMLNTISSQILKNEKVLA